MDWKSAGLGYIVGSETERARNGAAPVQINYPNGCLTSMLCVGCWWEFVLCSPFILVWYFIPHLWWPLAWLAYMGIAAGVVAVGSTLFLVGWSIWGFFSTLTVKDLTDFNWAKFACELIGGGALLLVYLRWVHVI